MTFLNPLVLLGLFASSIPLLLHLFNLRKSKPIEFSTLRFLKELKKTSIRKLKIKRIILLILRTLLITFIVLAFARPTIQSSLPVLGTHAKTSAVIIIDNSASMNVSDGRGNRFVQAKNIASSIINALKEGDEIAIISSSSFSDNSRASLTSNFALARQDIEKLQQTAGRFDLAKAMKYASSLIEPSNNIGKEVFILTDGQSNSIKQQNFDSTILFKKGIGIYLIPIGTDGENIGSNISVDSVRIVNSFLQKNKPIEIEATLRNANDKDIQGIVVSCLFNDRRVAQKSVDLSKNEVRKVIFSAIPDADGIIRGTIETENDVLEADNKRYFTIYIPPSPKVAILGSQNNVVFTDVALKAAENLSGSLRTSEQYLSSQTMGSTDWNGIQCIIATEFISDNNLLARLQQFVEEGGGLLYFTDTKVNTQQISSQLNMFGFGEIKEVVAQKNQPLTISTLDKRHPLFSTIIKSGANNQNPTIGDYMINKVRVLSGGTPIVSVAEGAIISERHIGKGKMICCGLPATNEWSNLVQLPIFPALVVRGVQYLSQVENVGRNYSIDETILLPLPKSYNSGGTFSVIDPLGVSTVSAAAQYPGGGMLPLGEAKISGSYSVFSDSKPVCGFTVNSPADEGHLTYISDDNLKEIVETNCEKEVKVNIIDETSNIARNVALARTGTELWKACLFMVLLCAIAEMIVARTSKNELASE